MANNTTVKVNIETIFDNRYRYLSKIGEGGMGAVYLVVSNDQLHQKRAVKEISYNRATGEDALHEAHVLKDLQHDGIPRIIEIKNCFEEQKFYIVQEFVEGVTLKAILAEEGKVAEGIVYEWFIQIAQILRYIHSKGVVHRDIKPENMMLTKEGKIKIIDFGISSTNCALNIAAYTEKYASPEQLRKSVVGPSSDIYSLGLTMYEMLTGKNLILDETLTGFKEASLLDSEKTLAGLVQIIEKATQINVKKRYVTSDKLVFDLNRVHKITRNYKRAVWLKDIKIGVLILMIASGLLLIYGGRMRIAIEREVDFRNFIEIVYRKIDNNDLEGAEHAVLEAEKLFKETTEVAECKALLLYFKNRPKDSVSYIKSLGGGMVYNSKKLNYLMGYAYLSLEQYLDANKWLERAYTLDDKDEDVARDYAVSCVKINDMMTAKAVLNRMEKGDFSKLATYYVASEVNAILGDYDKAVEGFNQCLSLATAPMFKNRVYLALAKLYKEQTNHLQDTDLLLVDILNRALNESYNQDNLVFEEMLAEAYYICSQNTDSIDDKNRYYALAIKSFEALIEAGNDRAYLYKNLAIIHQQLEDFNSAKTTLKEMIAQYPDDASGYIQLTWLLIEIENKKPKALRNYLEVATVYNETVEHFRDIDKEVSFQQLQAKLSELVAKKWLKPSDVYIK